MRPIHLPPMTPTQTEQLDRLYRTTKVPRLRTRAQMILLAAEQHDGFACMIVDGAQTIALVRLPWGGNHDLLTSRTPQGAQGGPPADSKFGRIVKDLAGFQMVAGVCTRLFCTAYAGSGRRI